MEMTHTDTHDRCRYRYYKPSSFSLLSFLFLLFVCFTSILIVGVSGVSTTSSLTQWRGNLTSQSTNATATEVGTHIHTWTISITRRTSTGSIESAKGVSITFNLTSAFFARPSQSISLFGGSNEFGPRIAYWNARDTRLKDAFFGIDTLSIYERTHLTLLTDVVTIIYADEEDDDPTTPHIPCWSLEFEGLAQCPSNYQFISDTKECVPIPPKFEYSTRIFGGSIAFNVCIILFEVGMILSILHFRTSYLFRTTSPLFSILILFGLILIGLGGITSTLNPDEHGGTAVCHSQIWMIVLGLSITLTSISVRAERIRRIFIQNQLKRTLVTNRSMFRVLMIVMTIQLMMLVIFSSIPLYQSEIGTFGVYRSPRPPPNMVQSSYNGIGYTVTKCVGSSKSIVWFIVEIIILSFLLVMSGWNAWHTRKVPSHYGESFWIGSAVYMICFFVVTLIPLQVFIRHATDPDGTILVMGFGFGLLNLTLFTILFATKIYFLVSRQHNVEYISPPTMMIDPLTGKVGIGGGHGGTGGGGGGGVGNLLSPNGTNYVRRVGATTAHGGVGQPRTLLNGTPGGGVGGAGGLVGLPHRLPLNHFPVGTAIGSAYRLTEKDILNPARMNQQEGLEPVQGEFSIRASHSIAEGVGGGGLTGRHSRLVEGSLLLESRRLFDVPTPLPPDRMPSTGGGIGGGERGGSGYSSHNSSRSYSRGRDESQFGFAVGRKSIGGGIGVGGGVSPYGRGSPIGTPRVSTCGIPPPHASSPVLARVTAAPGGYLTSLEPDLEQPRFIRSTSRIESHSQIVRTRIPSGGGSTNMAGEEGNIGSGVGGVVGEPTLTQPYSIETIYQTVIHSTHHLYSHNHTDEEDNHEQQQPQQSQQHPHEDDSTHVNSTNSTTTHERQPSRGTNIATIPGTVESNQQTPPSNNAVFDAQEKENQLSPLPTIASLSKSPSSPPPPPLHPHTPPSHTHDSTVDELPTSLAHHPLTHHRRHPSSTMQPQRTRSDSSTNISSLDRSTHHHHHHHHHHGPHSPHRPQPLNSLSTSASPNPSSTHTPILGPTSKVRPSLLVQPVSPSYHESTSAAEIQ